MRGVAYEREEELLESVSRAARGLLQDGSLPEALDRLAEAAGAATGSDLVIVRALSQEDRCLVARAVHAESPALAAELEGSRLSLDGLDSEEIESSTSSSDETLPAAIRNVAARARAETTGVHPVRAGERIVGMLELYRTTDAPFEERERMLGRLAAAHVGIAIRLEHVRRSEGLTNGQALPLELLGEALVAGADEAETAEQVVRLATLATGAVGAALWRLEADAPPSFLARHGFNGEAPDHAEGEEDVRAALADRQRAGVTRRSSSANGSGASVATIPLGEPPVGALQLYFESEPAEDDLALLLPFSARAALALRRSRRVGLIATALRRSQTIIGVVSQAIAQLSLAHTLETAVERIAELTASGHVAVYLREGRGLSAAASRGLEGPHTDLAERLLELALGPFRGRGFLFIEDMRRDSRLKGLEEGWETNGIRRALVVPLIVHDEVIGALAVYKSRARPYREGEESLLLALSSQLAVAVENARLHERTKELGEVLEATLDSERRSSRQLRGLYEISASFSESLSLDATIEAVAKTMVELFDLDAAVIRMPGARGEVLEPKAIYVGDASLRATAEQLLALPQPMDAPLARKLLRSGRPVAFGPGMAHGKDAHRTLKPFLAQGGSAAIIPIATPGELLATLTLVSLDPARPIERGDRRRRATDRRAGRARDRQRSSLPAAEGVRGHDAALAAPARLPGVAGLELGDVYESAARLEVGGDVYDYLTLDDGRLAVVLGDVTGHGVEATADMAMAKYVFRVARPRAPRARRLPRAANEVVVLGDRAGQVHHMVYARRRRRDGRGALRERRASAAATRPAGRRRSSELGGARAGARDRRPTRSTRRCSAALARRDAIVVLYTDGVIEARRGGELYGMSGSTRCSAAPRECSARRSSPRPCSPTAAASRRRALRRLRRGRDQARP